MRGRGAMCAIELVADRGDEGAAGRRPDGGDHDDGPAQGVIVLTAGTYGNVVRLLPPINIDEALLADGLDVLESAVATALA